MSCRSGTIRAAIDCSTSTLTRRCRNSDRCTEPIRLNRPVGDPLGPFRDLIRDVVLGGREGRRHLSRRRLRRLRDQRLQRSHVGHRARVAGLTGVPDRVGRRGRRLVRGDDAEPEVGRVRELGR